MNTVRSFFGIPSPGAKKAMRDAQNAQTRSARAAEEQSAVAAASSSVSGARLRSGGRRSLAFAGQDTGLATTLGG